MEIEGYFATILASHKVKATRSMTYEQYILALSLPHFGLVSFPPCSLFLLSRVNGRVIPDCWTICFLSERMTDLPCKTGAHAAGRSHSPQRPPRVTIFQDLFAYRLQQHRRVVQKRPYPALSTLNYPPCLHDQPRLCNYVYKCILMSCSSSFKHRCRNIGSRFTLQEGKKSLLKNWNGANTGRRACTSWRKCTLDKKHDSAR